jgi:hypothetical protein
MMPKQFLAFLGILAIAAGLFLMVAFYVRRGVIPDKGEHGKLYLNPLGERDIFKLTRVNHPVRFWFVCGSLSVMGASLIFFAAYKFLFFGRIFD